MMKSLLLPLGAIMLYLCLWHPVGAQEPQSSAQSSPQSSSDLTSLLIDIGQHAPSRSSASAPSVSTAPVAAVTQEYNNFRLTQERNKFMSIVSVICAALFALGMILFVLVRRPQTSPTDIVHGSGLVLVVFATVLVVTMAETEQQLTAAIGILGAIVGYLFGATSRTTLGTRPAAEQPAPSNVPTSTPTPAQPSAASTAPVR